jgi:cell division protein FtsB
MLALFFISLALIGSFAATRYLRLQEIRTLSDQPMDFIVSSCVIVMLFSIGLLTPFMGAIFIHFRTNGRKIFKKENRINEEIQTLTREISRLTNEKTKLEEHLNFIEDEMKNFDPTKKWEMVKKAFEDSYRTAQDSLLTPHSKKYIWERLKIAYNFEFKEK